MRPLTDEQFWARIDRSGGPDACWPWTGYRGRFGYGELMRYSKRSRAHRVALTIAKGPPPFEGALAIHSCDNPPCCNPTHLRWATYADNSQDALNRGRTKLPPPPRLRGEAHGRAILTEEDVRSIRSLSKTLSRAHLSAMFGADRRTIGSVIRRESWKHVD